MAKKKKTAKPEKHHFDAIPFKSLQGVVVSDRGTGLPEVRKKVAVEQLNQGVIDSFAAEMKMLGVEPMTQTDEIDEEELSCPIVADVTVAESGDQSDRTLFLAAMTNLTVSFEDSTIECPPRPKAMSKRIKQVKQGKLIPEASLDLHGFYCAEAVNKLHLFLQNAQHHGWQTLLVVTGKGLHSATGEPILRTEIERYLSAEGKQQVIEWSRAPKQYGGDGALVLFLAKR